MMRITGSDEAAFQELISRRGPLSFLTSKRAGGVNPGQKLQMLTSVRAQCLRSEIRALEALRRLMDTTLQSYPSTLAQDRERLALPSGDEDNSPTLAPGNARTGARRANIDSVSQGQPQGRAQKRTGVYYGRPAAGGGEDADAGLFDLAAPLPKLSNARNAAIQVPDS